MLWYIIVIDGYLTKKKRTRLGRWFQQAVPESRERARFQRVSSIQPPPGLPMREIYEQIVDNVSHSSGIEDPITLYFYIAEDTVPNPAVPEPVTGSLSREDIAAMVRAADTPEMRARTAAELRAASQRLHDAIMDPREYDPADNHDAETLADQGDLDGLEDPYDPDSVPGEKEHSDE